MFSGWTLNDYDAIDFCLCLVYYMIMKRLTEPVEVEFFGVPRMLSMERQHVRRRRFTTAVAGVAAGALIAGGSWFGVELVSRAMHTVAEKLEHDVKEYDNAVRERIPKIGTQCIEFAYGDGDTSTLWGLTKKAREEGALNGYRTLDSAVTDAAAVTGANFDRSSSFAACDGEVYAPSNVLANQLTANRD